MKFPFGKMIDCMLEGLLRELLCVPIISPILCFPAPPYFPPPPPYLAFSGLYSWLLLPTWDGCRRSEEGLWRTSFDTDVQVGV